MRSSPSLLAPVRAVGLLLAGILAVGCASSGSPSVQQPTPTQTRTAEAVETDLRAAAEEWRGVPQEWGGTTKEGVDCSGLVQHVYDTKFQLALPRTTDRQVQTGTQVSRSALQPGDLVFFRHNRKDYHVGIYLSDGEFLHTSTEEGVTVTPLDRPYWDRRWWQARRLLDLSGAPRRVASDSLQTGDSGSGIGW